MVFEVDFFVFEVVFPEGVDFVEELVEFVADDEEFGEVEFVGEVGGEDAPEFAIQFGAGFDEVFESLVLLFCGVFDFEDVVDFVEFVGFVVGGGYVLFDAVDDEVFCERVFGFFEFGEEGFCGVEVVLVFVVEVDELEEQDSIVGELFDAGCEVVVHVVEEAGFLYGEVGVFVDELFQGTLFVDAVFLVDRDAALQENFVAHAEVAFVRFVAAFVALEEVVDQVDQLVAFQDEIVRVVQIRDGQVKHCRVVFEVNYAETNDQRKAE